MPRRFANPTGAPLSLALSHVLKNETTIKKMISAGTPISATMKREGMEV